MPDELEQEEPVFPDDPEDKHTRNVRVRPEMAAGGYVLESPDVGQGYYSGVGHATQRDPHPVHGGGVDAETARANAQLMATAWKMLPALRKMIEVARHAPGGWGLEIDEAESVCSEATGRSTLRALVSTDPA